MEYEKQFLQDFSTQYDRFKGKEQTLVRNDEGNSSDGKYSSQTKITYSFTEDKIGINVNISFQNDDGESDVTNKTLVKGRDIINFEENKNLKMFDGVQDIVDMYPKTNNET